MPFAADREYDGSIIHAATIFSQSGTCGIQVTLEAEPGNIDHVFWLTDKTSERVKADLKKLGCTDAELMSETALENIGQILSGRECRFTTVEETYQGKTKIKVRFVNPRRGTGQTSAAATAAAMFGGKPKTAAPITDDDIPF